MRNPHLLLAGLVILLYSSAIRAQDGEVCDDTGCYFDDTWADDFGTYGTSSTDGSGPLFDITVTLLSPTGNTDTNQSYCTNSQPIDTFLGWDGNDYGDYTLTANYNMYYVLDGYIGCWGTPLALKPQILTSTTAPVVTFYKNPIPYTYMGVPYPDLWVYTDLACYNGTQPTCVGGGALNNLGDPPPYFLRINYVYITKKFLGVTYSTECAEVSAPQSAPEGGNCT